MIRTSIRYRLIVLMILLTTVPVLIVTLYATHNTRSSVEKEMIEANRSRMLWAQQYLGELVSQVDVLFYSLQINQSLMNGLTSMEEQSLGQQFRTQQYIQETLTTAFYANSRKIDQLSLYTHGNQSLYSVHFSTSGLIHSLDIRKGPWSRMLAGPINLYFKQSGDSIYAFHSVNDFETRQLIGGLSVRINDKVWKQVGDILRSDTDSVIYLMNDEGELLLGSSSADRFESALNAVMSEIGTGEVQPFRRTDRYFLFAEQVNNGSLVLLKAVPVASVTQSADSTVKAGLLAGLLFAGLSILASILVSLRISRPIVSLAKTMRTARIHNFEMTSVRSSDEIGLLERGYNSMMQRMKELIEHEYQREIEMKNAQLLALQAQINPHFLNNTLILIGGLALSKGVPEIYKITKGIGDLLRYSIGSGDKPASLRDEMRNAQNYLLIQEQRFVGRCSVVLRVDDDLPDLQLPRFTLQPLIENAFEHGLQPKTGAWEIEIRVRRVGRRVGILIRDNGIGMNRETLLALRQELRQGISFSSAREHEPDGARPQRREGIGLRNVDSRLKLSFNGNGVRLFSKKDAGTLIVLTLPVGSEETTDEERSDH